MKYINALYNKYSDEIHVLGAGGGSISLTLANIDLVLKILIGLASLGYIIYKWYKESKRP